MAQLTGLGIENFRVFKDFTEFEFAPITILTGTNSSGKSSLFKALLLLADNAQRNGLTELDFTGEGHQLGTFETVKTKGSEEEKITFTLYFSGVKDMLFGLLENGYSLMYNFKEGKLVSFRLLITENNETIKLYGYDAQYSAALIDLNCFLKTYLKNMQKGGEKENTSENLSKDFSKEINEAIVEAIAREFNEAIGREVFKKELHLLQQFTPESVKVDNSKFENIFEVNCHGEVNILNRKSLLSILDSFDKESVSDFLDVLNNIMLKNVHSIRRGLDNYLDFSTWKYSEFNRSYSYITEDEDGNEYEESDVYPRSIGEVLPKGIIEENLNQDYFTLIKDETANGIVLSEFHTFVREVLAIEMNNLGRLLQHTNNVLLSITYLEAVRANTRRIYNFRTEGTGFNELVNQIARLYAGRLPKVQDGKGLEEIKEFTNKWLFKFGIAKDIEIQNVEGAAHKVFLTKKNGEKINLADLGYGVTQLLPIILKIMLFVYDKRKIDLVTTSQDSFSIKRVSGINKENGLFFLLEEPETNLHPKLQSLLADFLVDVAKEFHITLLVETHSEYLIRKLQYLTAKKEIKPEDTAIYYFYEPDNVPADKKQVERIRIQADGSLDNDFGTGFFDEADNLAIDLFNITKSQRN